MVVPSFWVEFVESRPLSSLLLAFGPSNATSGKIGPKSRKGFPVVQSSPHAIKIVSSRWRTGTVDNQALFFDFHFHPHKDTEDTASTFATSFDCISSALMTKETLPVERITDSTCGCDPQNCRVQPNVAVITFQSIEVDSQNLSNEADKQFLQHKNVGL